MPKRKTNAQFKQEIKNLVGNEYEFLEPYVNNHTKIRVRHNKCGKTYEVTPHNFFNGKRCPYCAGNANKNNTQFKQEIYNLVNNEYTFLETYVNSTTKLRVKHNKCGNIYEVQPNAFLRGTRCPYCNGNAKKTDAEFKKEVFDLVGDEYTFLDPYINATTKIKVEHNKCGHIYKVIPSHFLSGSRCPFCYGTLKKTDAQFKQEIFNLVGNEYILLAPYVNAYTKLKVKHSKCRKIYEVTPANFLQGKRCPFCYGNIKKTDEQFKKEVYDLVGNEYTFLDSYVNTNTKIRVEHNKCGHIYKVRPDDFFNKHSRCPYCNNPKGENLINKILKSLGIKYESQKKFDDLKDNQPLSYDFYIPDQSILIEYQGIQHYKSVDYFGGEPQFKKQQKHDKLKADYAKANGYKLITVPYTEDTFSKIKKYLIKCGLNK